jgi:hypothetical protein
MSINKVHKHVCRSTHIQREHVQTLRNWSLIIALQTDRCLKFPFRLQLHCSNHNETNHDILFNFRQVVPEQWTLPTLIAVTRPTFQQDPMLQNLVDNPLWQQSRPTGE